jgi:hypothetical protein
MCNQTTEWPYPLVGLTGATGPAGDFWTFGPLLDSLLVAKYSSFHKNDVAKIRRVSGLQKVPEIKTYEK